ncbi:hypothetical protein D1872_217330 [compost metagenome]
MTSAAAALLLSLVASLTATIPAFSISMRASRSRVSSLSPSLSAFFEINGKNTLAIIKERRITPAARKMIRSRSGKGLPSCSKYGIENAAAKVTAPRTPDKEIRMDEVSFGLSISSPVSSSQDPFQNKYTHTKRNKIRPAKIIPIKPSTCKLLYSGL